MTRRMTMPAAEEVLPGRAEPLAIKDRHYVLGHPLLPPFPDGLQEAIFAMGCFWGAEQLFWEAPGVWTTAAGYAGGFTPNPTYEEVCTGLTGHAEAVRVIFDPGRIGYEALLRLFWENHDPTQGMRQHSDFGTQYRSMIFVMTPQQASLATQSYDRYAGKLQVSGFAEITTSIAPPPVFYYAEDYHQQYLAKNPSGYCGLRGTGVACPSGSTTASG